MDDFQSILTTVGFVIRALGFVVLGFGLGRFTTDAYRKAVWQVQIALAVGFFGLLVGLTNYASPGSMGMFAIGAGAAFIMSFMAGKDKPGQVETGKK